MHGSRLVKIIVLEKLLHEKLVCKDGLDKHVGFLLEAVGVDYDRESLERMVERVYYSMKQILGNCTMERDNCMKPVEDDECTSKLAGVLSLLSIVESPRLAKRIEMLRHILREIYS